MDRVPTAKINKTVRKRNYKGVSRINANRKRAHHFKGYVYKEQYCMFAEVVGELKGKYTM